MSPNPQHLRNQTAPKPLPKKLTPINLSEIRINFLSISTRTRIRNTTPALRNTWVDNGRAIEKIILSTTTSLPTWKMKWIRRTIMKYSWRLWQSGGKTQCSTASGHSGTNMSDPWNSFPLVILWRSTIFSKISPASLPTCTSNGSSSPSGPVNKFKKFSTNWPKGPHTWSSRTLPLGVSYAIVL